MGYDVFKRIIAGSTPRLKEATIGLEGAGYIVRLVNQAETEITNSDCIRIISWIRIQTNA
jgi:hypothetical protein